MGTLGEELTPEELERKYYRKFRTGFTYKEVSDMLWSYAPDPATWHKGNATGKTVNGKAEGTTKKVGTRRRCILRKWCEIKKEMWHRVLNECAGLERYIEWIENFKAQRRAA